MKCLVEMCGLYEVRGGDVTCEGRVRCMVEMCGLYEERGGDV